MSPVRKLFYFQTLRVQSVGAHLSVAFVSDPLNLNLFPPHGSGVAAGGARGSGEVRVHGWLQTDFSLLLKAGLFRIVLSEHADGVGREVVTRWEKTNRLKNNNKKKKIGRRRRGRTGLGARRPLQIMVLFPGSGHPPLRLNWGLLTSPSPQLGSS